MKLLKNWALVISFAALSQVGCASKSLVNKAETAPPAPPRPWQKIALKGVTQTSLDAFGTKVVIRAWPSKVTPTTNSALLDAVTEIKRIDQLTNPNFPNSEVSKINQGAFDGPVQISDELALLLMDCSRMFQISEGKFDITYVPYKTEKDFTDDDINKIANWDAQPKLSSNPQHLMGPQGMLLDQSPPRIRRYNRRTRLNLNGVIRGYAIEKVARILADRHLGGFAVIADGLIGAAGVALQDPGLMCIENPQVLGKCLKQIKATDPTKVLFIGSSASLERRGAMYDPNAAWSYRSGGVIIAGNSGKWVQFGTTYGSIADEAHLHLLFDPKASLGLAGIYFDTADKSKLVGTLSPYASF